MTSLTKLLRQSMTNPTAALMEAQISRAIIEYMERDRERDGAFHVSGLLINPEDFCARKQVIRASGKVKVEHKPFPVSTLKVFWQGRVMHEKWQMLFREMGISRGQEVTRYSEYLDLVGTPDDEIEFMGKRYIVEIKSMNSNAFYHTRSAPKMAAVQATFYMYLSGVPRAVILCENKNDQNVKLFFVDFDYLLIKPFIDQHIEVVDYLSRKKLPIRECTSVKDKLAKKCPYADHCFKRGK